MRTLIVILGFWCCGLSVFGQHLLAVAVKSVKVNERLYKLEVTGKISSGWQVYAMDNKSQGIEGLKLIGSNSGVVLDAPKVVGRLQDYKDPLFEHAVLQVYRDSFALETRVHFKQAVPAGLNVVLTGFAAKGDQFEPVNDTLRVSFGTPVVTVPKLVLPSVNLAHPLSNCGTAAAVEDHSIFTVFLLGFIGGLLGLLTPCVFPMIPLTVSWFSGQSVNKGAAIRNGMLYGIFIIFIYLLGSLPFHLIGGLKPEIFNSLSTNVWVNLVFFAVFVFFALSFFGLFEITVSGKLTNKADSKSDLGSVAGIFFMALTLALVSFSCTGPILGSLLVGSLSSSSGAWALTAGMGGFGLALALPFTLFAMFPSWMKALPKSGGWLAVFKKSLAFIELALALKFLSNADLVGHWGILKREVFLGLWLMIALALAVYLLIAGGWLRKSFGALSLLFAFYLGSGLFGGSLELLSGFPPPTSYSVFKNKKEQGLKPNVLNDYQAALALAKKTGKPLMLDFTGWACVNCRKMEENVWTKPEVSAYIKSHFILVSLYVDDRKELPLDQQFMYGKKEIKTVGDLYATMESVNFKQVTQPLYVLLSNDEQLLNTPVGYTPDAVEYLKWLECGFNAGHQ